MESKKDLYLNSKFITQEGYTVTVIEYVNNKKVVAEFDNGLSVNTTIRNLTKGQLKNPYHKSVYDKGFYGVGEYTTRIKNIKTKAYIKWFSMMTRCYDEKYLKRQSSYEECFVCEEWLNFQIFAKWFYENNIDGYELDKDLICYGNKEYSPDKCCFVPKKLNSLLNINKKIRNDLPIGVTRIKDGYSYEMSIYGKHIKGSFFKTIEDAFDEYKNKRESYIKEVANKYKSDISEKVYDSLMKFEININM